MPTPAVRYLVSFHDAPRHFVSVTATVGSENLESMEWFLPTWTPGSYLIRDHARHLQDVRAVDPATGQVLDLEKTRTNRWTVKPKGAAAVQIQYRVYCRELSVRTNFVDQDWALLNGAATFMSPVGFGRKPHQVTFHLPPTWHDVVTELPQVAADHRTYMAANYDALVDAPVVAGSPMIATFQAGDRDHRIVNLGDTDLWNANAAAKDLQPLVETIQQFWGTIGYEKYSFLNVIGESGGGLEHDNSTVLLTSRWTQSSPTQYRKWLSLCAHEYFHTWNVRRLRPRSIAKYEYEDATLFPELWIAEGITSYYDKLLVRRSGLMTAKQYLAGLSEQIKELQTTPGRNVQSLSHASVDAWIEFYRPDENSVNSSISYYLKGSLVAWLLDAEIRFATNDQKSLDDVMRAMFADHADEGYSSEDFRKMASSIAGQEMTEWFTSHVDGVDELDYRRAMELYGLHWAIDDDPTTRDDSDRSKDKNSSAGDEGDDDETAKWEMGIQTRERDGNLIVDKVLADGPAAAAGMNVDDELVAVAGYRVSGTTLRQQLAAVVEPDKSVDVVIARRGKLQTLSIRATPEPKQTWKMQFDKNPSDEVLARRNHWLGITVDESDDAHDGDRAAAPKK